MALPPDSLGPAYHIATERLLLRCWHPGDATLMRTALDRSDAHLRPFIPFMKNEPRSLPETIQWLRHIRAGFDLDQHFRYAVFDLDETILFGESMMIDREQRGEREVGYWMDVEHCGFGYATESTGALVKVAFELDRVDRVELHCEPNNHGSIAVAKKLGFTCEATLARRFTAPNGEFRDALIWVLFRSDYPGTRPHGQTVRAFDVMGQPIL